MVPALLTIGGEVMAKRICPGCRKIYPQDVIVCPECKKRLADIEYDFEMALSMMKEPVLLTGSPEIETVYLEEGLRRRNIPFFVEEMQNAVPTDNYRENTIDIIPVTNYYVDRSSLEEALAVLNEAAEESEKDRAEPVIFLDMPEEEDEAGGEEDEADRSSGGFRKVFTEMAPSMRFNVLVIGLVAFFAFLGLFLALISLG